MCQGQQCTWHMPFPRKGVTQLHVRPHSTESSRSQPGFGKVSAATSLCLHSPALVPSFFSPTHPCFAITSCASGESLSCHIPTSCNALHWLHVVLCSKDTSPHTKQGVCGDRLQRGLSCAEGTHPSEGGHCHTLSCVMGHLLREHTVPPSPGLACSMPNAPFQVAADPSISCGKDMEDTAEHHTPPSTPHTLGLPHPCSSVCVELQAQPGHGCLCHASTMSQS